MTYEPLNRRLATLAAIFAFLGVILGVIALATNYWTLINSGNNNATETVNVQPTVETWNVCILIYIWKLKKRIFV